jgi:protein-S-isoprenylcysteine O-methyltransferase Ste14
MTTTPSTSQTQRGARVRVVPPLLYALPLALLLYLHTRVPWSMPPGSGRSPFGTLLITIGAAFCLSAIIVFTANQTTIVPNRPVSALVTEGPYRFTRNPMYTGLTLIYAGVSVVFGSWWPLLALPLVLFVMRRHVIAPEEEYLTEKYGAAYEIYCSHVRRWI